MKKLLILSLLLLPACHLFGSKRPATPAAEVTSWLTGSFSSAAQAAREPDDYFDIRLYMMPIWTERTDGHWMYVEQAAASALERPYRQRVYHIVDTTDGPRSDVYELPGDPLDYAGAWAEPERLDGLDPRELALRQGCSIQLTAAGRLYAGSTDGTSCESTLAGASYATSEVWIEPGRVRSWDRGFDREGRQVWGAELGPYVFEREP